MATSVKCSTWWMIHVKAWFHSRFQLIMNCFLLNCTKLFFAFKLFSFHIQKSSDVLPWTWLFLTYTSITSSIHLWTNWLIWSPTVSLSTHQAETNIRNLRAFDSLRPQAIKKNVEQPVRSKKLTKPGDSGLQLRPSGSSPQVYPVHMMGLTLSGRVSSCCRTAVRLGFFLAVLKRLFDWVCCQDMLHHMRLWWLNVCRGFLGEGGIFRFMCSCDYRWRLFSVGWGTLFWW